MRVGSDVFAEMITASVADRVAKNGVVRIRRLFDMDGDAFVPTRAIRNKNYSSGFVLVGSYVCPALLEPEYVMRSRRAGTTKLRAMGDPVTITCDETIPPEAMLLADLRNAPDRTGQLLEHFARLQRDGVARLRSTGYDYDIADAMSTAALENAFGAVVYRQPFATNLYAIFLQRLQNEIARRQRQVAKALPLETALGITSHDNALPSAEQLSASLITRQVIELLYTGYTLPDALSHVEPSERQRVYHELRELYAR